MIANAGKIPKSNKDCWIKKIATNKKQDRSNPSAYRDSVWEALVIWDCEARDSLTLEEKLKGFLGDSNHKAKD